MHSLGSLLPYYNALAKGISPLALGLARLNISIKKLSLYPEINQCKKSKKQTRAYNIDLA